MTTNYPKRLKELQGRVQAMAGETPGVMQAFSALHEEAVAPGALDGKARQLIALGIAVAARCDGCMPYHVHGALEAGASHDEIVETIGVAMLMGGGPALIYGCDAYEALRQFETVQ